jgi:hypothetical protein
MFLASFGKPQGTVFPGATVGAFGCIAGNVPPFQYYVTAASRTWYFWKLGLQKSARLTGELSSVCSTSPSCFR